MRIALSLRFFILFLPFANLIHAAEGPRPWTEYKTIMWISDSAYKKPEKIPLFFERLREMGINTAMVHNDGNINVVVENKFPYYVENMVNRGLCLKFSSKVTNWEKFVSDWATHGRPDSALVRDYCLDDTQWLGWARKEMQYLVKKNMGNQPLAYDIRDELSTTTSANPFDYDFNPITLTKFREWLKTQYADLTALNAEWETSFARWEDIVPFTTDQIKNRMASGKAKPDGKPDWYEVQHIKFNPAEASKKLTAWNFSPWADFRTYMDISLANALSEIRKASRELDPKTPVGVEGTQMPSAFGGYDFWRLSQTLDWVEPYDIGNAREIFGSFMPGKPIMTTVFEKDTQHAQRRLWHLLLEGDRACLIWWSEDSLDWTSPDYALSPKGRALAPVLKDLTSPLAQLFLNAEREYDPIFIHYSQPSVQTDWLIESTVDGSTWLRRFSSFEADHNRMAKARNGWLKLFQDLGGSPRFINSTQLETGLNTPGILVLPQSYALSDKEAEAVRNFLGNSDKSMWRVVCADGSPGLFDQHGKFRPRASLHDLFPPAVASEALYVRSKSPISMKRDIAKYATDRLKDDSLSDWREVINSAGFIPAIGIPADARVRVHRFKAGSARLLAFERNINYQMSEDLKQAGGNERLEKPIQFTADLRAKQHVYDLRSEQYLGEIQKIEINLDPWRPSLFAVLPQKLKQSEKLVQTLAGNLMIPVK